MTLATTLDWAEVASWLLAIALHGMAWAVLALGAGLLLRRRALAWQEALLRAALLGGVATGSLQWALGGPVAGMPAIGIATQRVAVVASDVPAPVLAPSHGPAAPATFATAQKPMDAAPPAAAEHSEGALARFAVGSALGTAVLGALGFVLARRRLWQRLHGRVPECDARVLAHAATVARTLGLAQTPHLSRHAALASPVAFGLLRPEICLPERTGELGDDELRALFGHELAHVQRGDAFWLLLGALAQAAFPWQLWLLPLRRRLCEVAELRCDASAARTASPLAVANCLVQVAAWVGAERPPLGALAMAARPSLLRVRVEHALADPGDRRPSRALVAALALLVGVALTAAVPGVRAELPGRGAPAVDVAPLADTGLRTAPVPGAFGPELAELLAMRTALEREAAALRTEFAADRDAATRQLLELLDEKLAAMARASERLEREVARWTNETTSGSARRTR
jgi:Zn-dependent protease with chaperone function